MNKSHVKGKAAEDLPGDFAIWIFIFAELLVFGVFFVAYAFARRHNVELFDTYQETLNRDIGALNTVLLITGSYFVVRAVSSMRQDRAPQTVTNLVLALACGAGFVVFKLSEFSDKLAEGITLSSNTFYMFYLSLTFFHFMHVILGMVILAAVALKTRQGAYRSDSMAGIETGASYWHMVDLVWIVLFPLVYVLK